MKILFICGSLEFGKDGVGDYAFELANALHRINHEVVVLSIYDKHISKSEDRIRNHKNIKFNIIRLSSQLSWAERVSYLQKLTQDFQPDWISLQYVPYSFHPKGLPYAMIKALLTIKTKAMWHIMFHETWVGISQVSPLKHKIIGFFQMHIAKSLVRKLPVSLTTTSNVLYQSVLKKAGITSQLLPLFSNIPLAMRDEKYIDSIYSLLPTDVANSSWLLAGIFGSLYPQANLAAALDDIYNRSVTQNRPAAFLSFGRMNEAGLAEYNRLEKLFAGKIVFFRLGEQSPEHVSNLLQMLDFGISCTPVQHIGKSGVYAAMKLHGLPVLLPAYEFLPEYDKLVAENRVVLEARESYEWSVEFICARFIQLLSAHSYH